MSALDWPQNDGAPRVGIYGGTFNPIHLGHLRAAEEVREALGLERLIFVPSARPPHKGDYSRGDATPEECGPDAIAPAELRLRWVREAVADRPGFEVDALEVDRRGPSYLVDTLEQFGAQLAPNKPVFVLGRDAFCDLGNWREPLRLLTLAHFAVTTRPPALRGTLGDWLPECARDEIELAPGGLSAKHRTAGTMIQLVPITALDISASDVRSRIGAGRSIRYLVPESVREEIDKSGIYARKAQDES
jgi:nicotinate-nucleotide adenylyltransferase